MTFITHSRVIQHYTSREYVIEEPISDLYITLESDKNDMTREPKACVKRQRNILSLCICLYKTLHNDVIHIVLGMCTLNIGTC